MNTLITKQKPKSLIDKQKLLIEFIGTFTLTYVGGWGAIYSDINTMTTNGVVLSQSLVLIGFTWFGLEISGAHYNPAITIALVLIKQINWYSGMFYVISQFTGALTGAAFIYIQLNPELITMIKDKSVIGIPRPINNQYDVSGIWGEVIGTYLLMYVYMATCSPHNSKRVAGVGAAAIGFIYFIGSITLGELSGGGFNPARSLGPAIIAGRIEKDQFIHFFGPLIGAILACMFYRYVFIEDEEDIKEEEQERQFRDMQATNLIKNTEVSEVY